MSDDGTPREVVFWDCDRDAYELSWEDQDEAIEYYLNEMEPAERPDELDVYGWARIPVTPDNIPSPLDAVLDRMAENDDLCLFGEDEEPGDKVTQAMRAAEKVFVDVVVREFKSWSCEVVQITKINVKEWLKEHDLDD